MTCPNWYKAPLTPYLLPSTTQDKIHMINDTNTTIIYQRLHLNINKLNRYSLHCDHPMRRLDILFNDDLFSRCSVSLRPHRARWFYVSSSTNGANMLESTSSPFFTSSFVPFKACSPNSFLPWLLISFYI